MNKGNLGYTRVIEFPDPVKRSVKKRKVGLNLNREGSVRSVNGHIYVDFMYLGERVREPSGLLWNEKNAKEVRGQLDKIIVAIKSGTFKFRKVFPNSKRSEHFDEKECLIYGRSKTPDQILFKDHADKWYDSLKNHGRVSERTLWGYKSYLNLYLIPFFGELPFSELNENTFGRFNSWAKNQRFKKKVIVNETVNKVFVPLKMICKNAAIKYGWFDYNPFFGFKKRPSENNSYDEISPFSIKEQEKIINALPSYWKPYFDAAFKIGFRQGEQLALHPDHIDWAKGLLHIRQAFTRNENGKLMLGNTKNRYSRRTIKLTPVMLDALARQKKIYDQFKGEYFFCSESGKLIDRNNLRQRIWIPALEKAGLKYREIKQTRHSFATNALGCRENPLWIAKVMGHRDTDMIFKVYSRYIENAGGYEDGRNLDAVYQGFTSNNA